MNGVRSALVDNGYDPSYERIATLALKRGRNGDGVPFEVDVVTRDGRHLGVVALQGDQEQRLAAATDIAFPLEDAAGVLGQRIADVLVENLAEQRRQTAGDGPDVYTRV